VTRAPREHSRTPFAGLKHVARQVPQPCSVSAGDYRTHAWIDASGQRAFRQLPTDRGYIVASLVAAVAPVLDLLKAKGHSGDPFD